MGTFECTQDGLKAKTPFGGEMTLPSFRPFPETSEYADLNDALQDIFTEEYVQPIADPLPVHHSLFTTESPTQPIRIDGAIQTFEEARLVWEAERILRLARTDFLSTPCLDSELLDEWSRRSVVLRNAPLWSLLLQCRAAAISAQSECFSNELPLRSVAVYFDLIELVRDELAGFDRLCVEYLYEELEKSLELEIPFRAVSSPFYLMGDLRGEEDFAAFLERQISLSPFDFEKFAGIPFDFVSSQSTNAPTVVVFLDIQKNAALQHDEMSKIAVPESLGVPRGIFDDMFTIIMRSRHALDNMLAVIDSDESKLGMMEMGASHYPSLRSWAERRGDVNVIFVRPEPTPDGGFGW